MLCTAAMYHVNVIIFNCAHVRPLVRRPNTFMFHFRSIIPRMRKRCQTWTVCNFVSSGGENTKNHFQSDMRISNSNFFLDKDD